MRVAQEWHDLAVEEQKLVRGVVDSICDKVPDLDSSMVERHARAALEEYRHSRVREFLPILLERAVLGRLAA